MNLSKPFSALARLRLARKSKQNLKTHDGLTMPERRSRPESEELPIHWSNPHWGGSARKRGSKKDEGSYFPLICCG